MFIVDTYPLAVFCCFVTMLCWGSWANTQKLAARTWRFELFYWDYVLGIVLFSLLFGLTAGSIGSSGRSFLTDLRQAATPNIVSACIGGIVFNAANILLSAAIAIAGMAVAFPIGIGIALVLGVLINYAADRQGNPALIGAGVGCIAVAILLNAQAYRKTSAQTTAGPRGIWLSVIAGVLMSFFYRFIAASMDITHFAAPAPGKMTPYSAVFVFSLGILLSNVFFNSLFLRRPVSGPPLRYADYFRGRGRTHLVGILGGLIWGLGNSLNLLASGKAGPAISYGLGQGATLVAAAWGVFVWKEIRTDQPAIRKLIVSMFVFFLAGITLVIMAGL